MQNPMEDGEQKYYRLVCPAHHEKERNTNQNTVTVL